MQYCLNFFVIVVYNRVRLSCHIDMCACVRSCCMPSFRTPFWCTRPGCSHEHLPHRLTGRCVFTGHWYMGRLRHHRHVLSVLIEGFVQHGHLCVDLWFWKKYGGYVCRGNCIQPADRSVECGKCKLYVSYVSRCQCIHGQQRNVDMECCKSRINEKPIFRN